MDQSDVWPESQHAGAELDVPLIDIVFSGANSRPVPYWKIIGMKTPAEERVPAL